MGLFNLLKPSRAKLRARLKQREADGARVARLIALDKSYRPGLHRAERSAMFRGELRELATMREQETK